MSTLALYRGFTRAVGPLAPLLLRRRLRSGKEDAARLGERLGHTGRPRPSGPLLWVHAASVGEMVAVLPLIERCRERRADLAALVTTGTVASARLFAERRLDGVLHQFVPLDVPDAVGRFLGHWRPDLALWVESELWPNLLGQLARRGVAAVLVNGRLSARSFARWSYAPGAARDLLATFRSVLAQSEADAARFARLGAAARAVGNLKADAPPLACDDAAYRSLAAAVTRPAWVAASIHRAEGAAIAEAHRRIVRDFPDVLTIVVPRHPERGAELAATFGGAPLRSLGAVPSGPVYVADTLGELGLFYRLARVAFVGGSLVPKGGHNPLEPARLGRPVLFGPHMTNFAEPARALIEAGGAARVNDAADLAAALRLLLDDPTRAAAMGAAAELAVHAAGGALAATMAVVGPLIDGLPYARA